MVHMEERIMIHMEVRIMIYMQKVSRMGDKVRHEEVNTYYKESRH
jgi:hypothetical protein